MAAPCRPGRDLRERLHPVTDPAGGPDSAKPGRRPSERVPGSLPWPHWPWWFQYRFDPGPGQSAGRRVPTGPPPGLRPIDVPILRRWRLWGASLVLLAIVSGGLAAFLWSAQARTPDGAICGSVWHYRPGHGSPSGGLLTAVEAARATSDCRRAAAPAFRAGNASAVVSAIAMLGGSVVLVVGVTSWWSGRRPGER
jgi:hypothetical protein